METHPPLTTAEEADALRQKIRDLDPTLVAHDPDLRDDLRWWQQRLWEWENAHSSPYPLPGDTAGWEHFMREQEMR